MMKPPHLVTFGPGMFGLFAVLGGLTLLVMTNSAAPGCTGPAVQRCDYIATAKRGAKTFYPFRPEFGFEVYDQGSAVLVQQWTPPGQPSLNHASSVLIDKRSCRVCQVDWHIPTTGDPLDRALGPLVARTPAEGR